MKIQEGCLSRACLFAAVEDGKCFVCDDKAYIKTNNVDHAVNLYTGEFIEFEYNQIVNVRDYATVVL